MTREQKEIVRKIIATGKRRGESKKEIKAALLTGRTESNYRNLNYGDRDSKGWRQERASLYKNPTNLDASINRFYDETSKAGNGKGKTSAQLAQAVQRSAFPDRYKQGNKEAENLLRGATGGNRSRAAEPRTTPTGDRRALLLQYVQNRHDPRALLELGKGIKDNDTAPGKPTAKKSSNGGGGKNPWKAAKEAGATVSSGKRPGAITSSGNISDHAEGAPGTMARDFVGKDMGKIAKRIAASLGIKNYKPGSIVNVKKNGSRYQLIYGTSDHKDHVHLGRKKL